MPSRFATASRACSSCADSAKNNVASGVSGFERAEQLAARHNIESGAEFPEERENRDARISLYAVVQSCVELPHRFLQALVLFPDSKRAIDVARRADLARNEVQ